MTTALLDADIIAFKAAAVSTETVIDEDDEVLTSSNIENARKAVDYIVKSWRSKAKASSFFCCLSDTRNFRKDLTPTYKANRKDAYRPEILDATKAYIADKYPVLLLPSLEADDVMGIYATNGQFPQAVIVSIDKDMQSVPGWFLNPDKSSHPIKISKSMANRYWLTQTLTGDPTDGYKGCPGIGPKKAAGIIEASSLAEAWQNVVAAYESAGLSEQDAILNAQLARILRAENWRDETKEIVLWHPTRSIILPTTPTGRSKPSTTSTKSADTTPETKQPTSPTSPSTSVGHPTRARRSKTSRKPSGTSKTSSN